jgi:hypothetical protein
MVVNVEEILKRNKRRHVPTIEQRELSLEQCYGDDSRARIQLSLNLY